MCKIRFSGTTAVLDLDEADTTIDTYSANATATTVTLSDGSTTVDFALTPTTTGTAGTDEKITGVTIGTAANLKSVKDDGGALKVLVTDTAGNKVDIGHTVLKGAGVTQSAIITASDLAYAASSENYFLEQASIQATIEADPLEWYVYHGWAGAGSSTAKTFIGKDLAGNAVSKAVKGDGTTGVQTFSSIQGAIDAITTETGLRIRVAEDHVEAGGNVNVDEDDLRIEFWDIAGADAATEVTTFNLDAAVKNLTLADPGMRILMVMPLLIKLLEQMVRILSEEKMVMIRLFPKVAMISYTQERVMIL